MEAEILDSWQERYEPKHVITTALSELVEVQGGFDWTLVERLCVYKY